MSDIKLIEILERTFRPVALPIANVRTQPRLCGVYIITQQDEIAYVGSSIDVMSRISSHISGFLCRRQGEVTGALWMALPKGVIKHYEGALIRSIQPKWNWNYPPHVGYDNEILEGLGLEPHADEFLHEKELRAFRQKEFRERKAERRRRSDAFIAANPGILDDDWDGLVVQ